ncbi:MAG TPA: S8 family serine peptidase [Candidatus Baltobacteraceae bacterium]|nr:S8 family serine peptidase [Candidatus Baltobacteraceae bacterium]
MALICALAACSGSPAPFVPVQSQSSASAKAPHTTADNPSALPGDNPSALPGDNPSALPGDNPSALPGDNPSALPGAQLACANTFAQGQANCTVAINLNSPVVKNAQTPANLLAGLHPADLQSRYGLPSANAGGLVAIVDAYDDPTAEVDLAAYRAAFGLPSCTSANGCFTKVDQRGGTSYPQTNLGWSQEIALDLDMVSAVCPNCSILLVEADSASFDDLGAGVDLAATHHPAAISNSYYGPEYSGETAEDVHYKHPGIAITVSSGDQRSPFYPAASPYATSVGGTSLTNNSGAWSESAWPYDGAGCSKYEAKPSWQGNTGCKTRSTVDVAAVADPQTGVTTFDSTAGGWYVVGGTSVAAPIVAAAYALSSNPQGPAYSYAHRSAFNAIGGQSGYFWTTGLGSPNGLAGL